MKWQWQLSWLWYCLFDKKVEFEKWTWQFSTFWNYSLNTKLFSTPPWTRHFSGFRVSTIENAKTHPQELTGINVFTFEEFHILFCFKELIWNLWPICVLSEDSNDEIDPKRAHLCLGSRLNQLPLTQVAV